MTTDATLLSAWRNGDDAAGRTLIERHMPRLYRFFASRIEAEADDLCQQTLADCVKNRDKIEDDAEGRNFRAYLFTIARRRLLKYYRTRRRAAARFDPLEQSVADLSPAPSSALAKRQEARLVLEAMRRLPIDYQIAVELHYWEDLTTGQIAVALEIPVGTVKTRIVRARARMRETISELAADPDVARATIDRAEEIAIALGRRGR